MNRREFTRALSRLLTEMVESGYEPIIDYVMRSKEEQNRLYMIGRTRLPDGRIIETGNWVTKMDGIIKRSAHQSGVAADIYLVYTGENGKLSIDWKPEDAKRWHDRWVALGGKPMIEWDAAHFEG